MAKNVPKKYRKLEEKTIKKLIFRFRVYFIKSSAAKTHMKQIMRSQNIVMKQNHNGVHNKS